MDHQVEEAGRVAMQTGRVLGGLFCLVLLLSSLAAAGVIGRKAWADLQPHFWDAAQCRIVQSEPTDAHSAQAGKVGNVGKNAPGAICIRYEYCWGNRTYVSGNVFRRTRCTNSQARQQLLDRYPVNALAVCHVNPARPDEAVLERPFPWLVLWTLIPLGVAGVAAAGSFGALRARTPRNSQPAGD